MFENLSEQLSNYRGVGMARTTSQQLASLSLLDDSGSEVEGEHRSCVPLLLVQLVRLRLPLADGQRFRGVPRDLSG